MLFYLATIIIHDIFRTVSDLDLSLGFFIDDSQSHEDFTISDTSSYLDLAPLYGSNQPEQDAVRTFQGGKLKPDTFSEKRILGFPPGVSVFLIMYVVYLSRFLFSTTSETEHELRENDLGNLFEFSLFPISGAMLIL